MVLLLLLWKTAVGRRQEKRLTRQGSRHEVVIIQGSRGILELVRADDVKKQDSNLAEEAGRSIVRFGD